MVGGRLVMEMVDEVNRPGQDTHKGWNLTGRSRRRVLHCDRSRGRRYLKLGAAMRIGCSFEGRRG